MFSLTLTKQKQCSNRIGDYQMGLLSKLKPCHKTCYQGAQIPLEFPSSFVPPFLLHV